MVVVVFGWVFWVMSLRLAFGVILRRYGLPDCLAASVAMRWSLSSLVCLGSTTVLVVWSGVHAAAPSWLRASTSSSAWLAFGVGA